MRQKLTAEEAAKEARKMSRDDLVREARQVNPFGPDHSRTSRRTLERLHVNLRRLEGRIEEG